LDFIYETGIFFLNILAEIIPLFLVSTFLIGLQEGLKMWEIFIHGIRSIFYDDPELEQLEYN
jgi:hypothetical protein